MDYQNLITALQEHALTIETHTCGLTIEQARWKPDPESWSILEVINHLHDEEVYDFRPRLEIMLLRPGEPFAPNPQPEWVIERGYNTRELEPSVQNFLSERKKSLEWLVTLTSTNWDTSDRMRQGKPFHAGDMFASWVAHDVLHLRQLAELRFELVKRDAEPYDVAYAGEW